jgi:CDP-diacylglycerol---glycerol-3-phosphate 3-phosphatidyltransferase
MANLAGIRKSIGYYLTEPAIRFLQRTPLTPNTLSWLGLCLSAITAAVIALGYLLAGGLLLLFSGYFDILDGALARRIGKTTAFGGVLDSTFDRIAEALTLLGLLSLFIFSGNQTQFLLLDRTWSIFLAGVALLGSPLASHIRAKAETLGIPCNTGIFTRTERVIVLALGLLSGYIIIAVGIVALFSLVTTGERLYYVYHKAANRDGEQDNKHT